MTGPKDELELQEPLQEHPQNGTQVSNFCSKQKKYIFLILIISAVVILIVVPVSVVKTKSSSSTNTHLFQDLDPEPCIFYAAPTARDPFEEKCDTDSDYVKDYCPTEGVQKRRCMTCNGEKRLPLYCFCDAFDHCPENIDHARKSSCIDCTKEDGCPCLNSGTCLCVGKSTWNLNCLCLNDTNYKLDKGGTCQCEKLTAKESLHCSCPHGYTGKYCELLIRECNLSRSTSPSLKHCNETNENECLIYDSGNSTLYCSALKDHSNAKFQNCTIRT